MLDDCDKQPETYVISHFLDNDLRSLSASQLQQGKHNIASQLLHVQRQISDLAYGNYRTYADAGSTTERCRKLFGEASSLVEDIEKEIQLVRESTKEFGSKSDDISEELHCLKLTETKGSQLWDLLSLPNCMDVCIRAGYYDLAYSLTNYGVQLQTYGLTRNFLVKAVADKLIDARYQLLEELFNRFAAPIDLASSIQIVNSIRKIPYLSSAQLRISILQYRDVYLEKQLINIRSQPDFILRMVEVYRDCMYDTMVLYLAVFPENEICKRESSVDPRWDVWQTAGPSAILSDWVLNNLNAMFSHIKNAGDDFLDIGALTSKLMSFAMSFGRMGVDFRPLIADILGEFVIKRFSLKVHDAANTLRQCKSIEIDGDVPDSPILPTYQIGEQLSAPQELAVWDDLCVYGNALIDALNDLRNGLSPMQMNSILKELTGSLKIIVSWLCEMEDHVDKVVMEKAIKLLVRYFVPYINSCLLVLYPYEKCCRTFYHTAYTLEQYEKRCAVQIKELCNDNPNSTVNEKLLEEVNCIVNGDGEIAAPRENADADEVLVKIDEIGEQDSSNLSCIVPDGGILSDELAIGTEGSDNRCEAGVEHHSSAIGAESDVVI